MLSKIHNDVEIETLTLWLHFSQIPGIGPVKGAKLLQNVSLTELAGYSSLQLKQLGLTAEQISFWQRLSFDAYSSCIAWHNQANQKILYLDSPDYPHLLSQTPGAPLLLFVKGNADLLNQQQIALVGSRRPTRDGCDAAATLSRELSQHGLVITSGLAQGIDAICHQTAIQAGGFTVAVQGCGINHVYPAKHKWLAEEIIATGSVIVSEFLPDIRPRAEHFPRRNRIISGLSLGAVIVEAAERSGSLITARFANEQNRDVFAVPGRFGGVSAGCNRLIQQGAKLVFQTADILDELPIYFSSLSSNESVMNSTSEDVSDLPFSELLDNVSVNEVRSIDELADASGLPVQEVMTALITLELEGIILSVPGGYVRTRSN